MALCFSHAAAGYLAYEAVRPAGPHRPGLLAGAVVLANAPDFDFLPGVLIGSPGAFHRGFTHTLAAVVLVGLVGWLVGALFRRHGWPPGRVAGWAAAAYGSHLLLDFFTTDAKPPYGGPFLWPLSDAYVLSPVTVLREIIIDPSGRVAFLQSLIAPHTLAVWAFEVAVCASVVAAVHVVRAALARETAPVAEIADGS